MGYGSKSSDIREGASLGPGLHKNVVLSEVKAYTTEPTKGNANTYDVLDFTFKNSKGDNFVVRLFNPEGSEPDKIETAEKNVSDTAVYIISKVSGQESEIPETIESWKEFTDFVVANLPKDYNKIPMRMILIGNTYNGKARVQIPGLNKGGWIGGGWLQRMDSKEPFELSETHKKSIADYEAFVRKGAATSAASPAGGSASDEEIAF